MRKTTKKGIDRLYGYLRRGAVVFIVAAYLLPKIWSRKSRFGFWSFALDYYYEFNYVDIVLLIAFGTVAYFCCRNIKGWICLIPLLISLGLWYLCDGPHQSRFFHPGNDPRQWIVPTGPHPFWGNDSALQALTYKVLSALTIALLAWGIAGTVFSGGPHRYFLRRRKAKEPAAKRVDRQVCPYCGYDLRENTTGKCPECGKVTPSRINELIDLRQANVTNAGEDFVDASGDP